MVIVGLDLSTTSTGFSVYQDGELINHGRFRSDKKNAFDRIDEIYHMVGDLFKAYDIDVVFVEDVPLSSSMNKRICELHGLNFSWIDDKYDKTTGDSDEAEGILIGLAGTKLLNK